MIDTAKFKPKTVYVIYIATTRDRLWQALTDREMSRLYFLGSSVEIEPRTGGTFAMRLPDGRVNVSGTVVEWLPPRRLATTWAVEGVPEMRELPECLVTYEIEDGGSYVRLTATESYQWDVPEALLTGGRIGWPAILSSLKTAIETGQPLFIKTEPPPGMMEAVRQVLASKPWLK